MSQLNKHFQLQWCKQKHSSYQLEVSPHVVTISAHCLKVSKHHFSPSFASYKLQALPFSLCKTEPEVTILHITERKIKNWSRIAEARWVSLGSTMRITLSCHNISSSCQQFPVCWEVLGCSQTAKQSPIHTASAVELYSASTLQPPSTQTQDRKTNWNKDHMITISNFFIVNFKTHP